MARTDASPATKNTANAIAAIAIEIVLTVVEPYLSARRPQTGARIAPAAPYSPNKPACALPRLNGGSARWKASVAQNAENAPNTVAPRTADSWRSRHLKKSPGSEASNDR